MSRKGLFNGECATTGCTTTGAMGMSLWDASADNDRHRCTACNDAIDLLIPAVADRIWTLGLIDRTAYDAHVRGVVALSRAKLHAMAEPIRTREATAYTALVRLFDATPAHDVLVRDQVATLVNSSDLLTDATITNWWIQHRYHPTTRSSVTNPAHQWGQVPLLTAAIPPF